MRAVAEESTRQTGVRQEVPIDSIVPNTRQPRAIFDDAKLLELADSIRRYGILQPLVVSATPDGRYALIAGERRLRAAKIAGRTTVPISLRASDPQESLELALIENIQREDIGPMECARAYRKLMSEFGITQEQVAEKVGKARASIANTVRLLRLPTPIQEGLESGRIQEGHARALLAFETEDQQLTMFAEIVENQLSVREVERAARRPVKSKRDNPPQESPISNWEPLEDVLSTHLGNRVKVSQGKIVIDFYSDEDLERILAVLGLTL